MATYFHWSIAFRIRRAGIIEICFLMGIDRVEILFDRFGGRRGLFNGHSFCLGVAVAFGAAG